MIRRFLKDKSTGESRLSLSLMVQKLQVVKVYISLISLSEEKLENFPNVMSSAAAPRRGFAQRQRAARAAPTIWAAPLPLGVASPNAKEQLALLPR